MGHPTLVSHFLPGTVSVRSYVDRPRPPGPEVLGYLVCLLINYLYIKVSYSREQPGCHFMLPTDWSASLFRRVSRKVGLCTFGETTSKTLSNL